MSLEAIVVCYKAINTHSTHELEHSIQRVQHKYSFIQVMKALLSQVYSGVSLNACRGVLNSFELR